MRRSRRDKNASSSVTSPQTINEVFGADTRQENVGMARRPSGLGDHNWRKMAAISSSRSSWCGWVSNICRSNRSVTGRIYWRCTVPGRGGCFSAKGQFWLHERFFDAETMSPAAQPANLTRICYHYAALPT
jgi:hypothetical protein